LLGFVSSSQVEPVIRLNRPISGAGFAPASHRVLLAAPAGNRQDTHHPPSRIAAASTHHPAYYSRTGRPDWRVLPARTLLAASYDGDRNVDLIAREREQMHNPGQEVLLNKLLNEMDGLREDADVIFILTTNRPDHLEPALASRPGRIDQAIEFPLADEEGRRKLVQLYSGGLEVSPPIMDLLVRRTERASPAFIKELMRRAAQFQIELGTSNTLQQSAVDGAIEEMLFTGGALSLKLLGGPAAESTTK
jgi:hypothetical protein